MSEVAKKRLSYLKNKQQLLYLMLFSLATVIIWVTISLITSQKKPGISPELQKLAIPLNPTLNQETLRKIEQKQYFSEDDLREFPIYKIITSSNGIDEKVVTIGTAEEDIFPTTPPAPSPEPSLESSPAVEETQPTIGLPAPTTTPVASPTAELEAI